MRKEILHGPVEDANKFYSDLLDPIGSATQKAVKKQAEKHRENTTGIKLNDTTKDILKETTEVDSPENPVSEPVVFSGNRLFNPQGTSAKGAHEEQIKLRQWQREQKKSQK